MDIGSLLGLGIGLAILVLAVGILVSSFFIWVGARWARIPGASFGRAVAAALACLGATFLVHSLVHLVSGFVPLMGTASAVILSILFTLLIIRAVYTTSFGRAFLVWVLSIAAMFLTFLVMMGLSVLLMA
jgi:hypothetical protein